ncbi:TPA: hypothetical protein DF272_02855 [Candidatus Falkowbacteria bacterium]|nr:hypothetical protein [Candidatus Falkowbacteria bacterium]
MSKPERKDIRLRTLLPLLSLVLVLEVTCLVVILANCFSILIINPFVVLGLVVVILFLGTVFEHIMLEIIDIRIEQRTKRDEES